MIQRNISFQVESWCRLAMVGSKQVPPKTAEFLRQKSIKSMVFQGFRVLTVGRWCQCFDGRYDATQFGAGHLPPFDQLLRLHDMWVFWTHDPKLTTRCRLCVFFFGGEGLFFFFMFFLIKVSFSAFSVPLLWFVLSVLFCLLCMMRFKGKATKHAKCILANKFLHCFFSVTKNRCRSTKNGRI